MQKKNIYIYIYIYAEKYNRHTQQIMNLATQLAVKELLK